MNGKTVNWKDNNEERKTSKFLQLTPVITMETSSQIPVFLSLQSNSMHASVIDKLSLFHFIVQKLNKYQKCTIFSFICFFFLVHKRASLSKKKTNSDKKYLWHMIWYSTNREKGICFYLFYALFCFSCLNIVPSFTSISIQWKLSPCCQEE
jgi:hypothetical protein